MKAMILAAGLGTRMRPLTLHTPKPLLKINGIPLIEYHIRRLAKAGFKDIVINHAWLGEQIESYLGDGSRWNVNIYYSPENANAPLETAGGIRKALPLLVNDNESFFAVINGDVFTNYPFDKLLEMKGQLSNRQKMGHLVLVNNPAHNLSGDFCLDGDSVVSHGDGQESCKAFTFSGVSVLNASLFSALPIDEPAPLAPLLRAEIQKGRMSGEHFSGYWADVGTPERLSDIDQLVKGNQIHGL